MLGIYILVSFGIPNLGILEFRTDLGDEI